MEEDHPFPRVITFERLFAEERPGEVVEPEPASGEELRELPRPIAMPPLTAMEEEKFPDVRLDVHPDPILDGPAITDSMKSADDCVGTKFLKDNAQTLLQSWDDADVS